MIFASIYAERRKKRELWLSQIPRLPAEADLAGAGYHLLNKMFI
jgi:hypothetical protein